MSGGLWFVYKFEEGRAPKMTSFDSEEAAERHAAWARPRFKNATFAVKKGED